jgi:FMN phosphatase YigB (HAD superfamily)
LQTAQAQFRYDMVIFDVGGTLTGLRDHAPFQEFLADAGLPASEEDARHLRERLTSAIAAERDAAQGLGAKAAELDQWWRRIFSMAWPDRPDLAEEMFAWLLAGRLDRPFPDVLPTLEMLRGLGIPMGILSNFGMHLYSILDRFDLLDYFEFVMVSAEVGLAKPDRRVFELLVDKAKRPGHRLLYVG